MTDTYTITTGRDKLGEILDKCRAWSENTFENAVVMPSELYTSAAIAELEKRAIFSKEWICVGREEQVPQAGDFFTASVNEYPVIVVRSNDDQLLALANICRHRGMRLAKGSGNTKVFTCPYHAWTYNLDGSLRGAPFMQDVAGFDPGGVQLPEVKLECWQGFIYICLNPDADPLAPRLSGLADKMAEVPTDKLKLVFLETVEYECNWKVLLENFCESYHLFCVHRKTLEPMSPTRKVKALEGADGWNLHRMEYDPHDGVDAHTGYISAVYPNHAISFGGKTGLLWITTAPIAVDRTRVNLGVSSPPDIDGGKISEEFREKTREFVFSFLSEDKEIIESVQKNLPVFEPTQPYCDMERTNWEFGQYLVRRLLAEAAR